MASATPVAAQESQPVKRFCAPSSSSISSSTRAAVASSSAPGAISGGRGEWWCWWVVLTRQAPGRGRGSAGSGELSALGLPEGLGGGVPGHAGGGGLLPVEGEVLRLGVHLGQLPASGP